MSAATVAASANIAVMRFCDAGINKSMSNRAVADTNMINICSMTMNSMPGNAICAIVVTPLQTA
jgi:hypothetical protein